MRVFTTSRHNMEEGLIPPIVEHMLSTGQYKMEGDCTKFHNDDNIAVRHWSGLSTSTVTLKGGHEENYFSFGADLGIQSTQFPGVKTTVELFPNRLVVTYDGVKLSMVFPEYLAKHVRQAMLNKVYNCTVRSVKPYVPSIVEHMVKEGLQVLTLGAGVVERTYGVSQFNHSGDPHFSFYGEDNLCFNAVHGNHKELGWNELGNSVYTIALTDTTLTLKTENGTYHVELPEHVQNYIKDYNKENMKMSKHTTTKEVKKHWVDLEVGDVIKPPSEDYYTYTVTELKHSRLRVTDCDGDTRYRTLKNLKGSGYCGDDYVFTVLVQEEVKYPIVKGLDDVVVGDVIELEVEGYKNRYLVTDRDYSTHPLRLKISDNECDWIHRSEYKDGKVTVVGHKEV